MPSPLHELISDIIGRFADAIGVPCQIDIDEPKVNGVVEVRVSTDEDAKFLIGKNGQNLAALEHVIRAASYRKVGTDHRIVIDVNGYREERNGQVAEATKTAVIQVRETGRSVTLPPMTPSERRIVHTELSGYTDVESESIGVDPHRRVVIKPVAL